MEDSIGSPLFERLPRGLKPTHHGDVLLSHARRVLNEMSRAQSNLAALHDAATERVIVGTTPPTAAAIIPVAIAEFLRLRPKAKIDIWESSMSVLLEKLEQGAVDIVVGGLDNYQPSASFQSELLYPESTQIIARSKHPLARKRKPLTWDDLYSYDWIVWPLGTPIRSKLDLALSRAGRPPLPYRVESSSLTANLALLERSDMLGAVSGRLSRYFGEHGAIDSLPFPLDADSAVGMYWRTDAHQTLVKPGNPLRSERFRTLFGRRWRAASKREVIQARYARSAATAPVSAVCVAAPLPCL